MWPLIVVIASSPGEAVGHPELSVSERRILSAHNEERVLAGVPPLLWDKEVGVFRRDLWAKAGPPGPTGSFTAGQRPGQRENLARTQSAFSTPERLVGSWVAEKENFQPGIFPNVSRTGSWADVAHYTQMIWRTTTHVGCAIHREGGWDYLICRYAPPGNIDGTAIAGFTAPRREDSAKAKAKAKAKARPSG